MSRGRVRRRCRAAGTTMREKRFAAAVAWSSEPKKEPRATPDRDRPDSALRVVIGHSEPPSSR